MNRNEVELKEIILDLQLLNRELQHDIRELQKEMLLMQTELLQFAHLKIGK